MPEVIIPGYDFTINEVPDRAKFLQQAEDLQITVSMFDMSSGLRGVLHGDLTDNTGAIIDDEVGVIWVDQVNDVWVRTQTGPVRMIRGMGGWESNRYFVFEDPGFGEAERGFPVTTINPPSGGFATGEDWQRGPTSTGVSLTTNAVMMQYQDTSMHPTTGGWHDGIQTETGYSGYTRWVGRGGCIMQSYTQTAAGAYEVQINKYNIYQYTENVSPTKSWSHVLSVVDNTARGKFCSVVLSLTSESSTVSDAFFATAGRQTKKFWMSHFFGPPLFSGETLGIDGW